MTSVLVRFGALDTTAVSDALDGLGLSGALGGLAPMWGRPKLVGFAVTVRLEPFTPGASGAHIAVTAVVDASPDDVIVVANDGRTDVSCWGGLLSLGASLRGVRGVVADGACREVGEARELDFPVFARGTTPVTARGRLQQRSNGGPVQVGALTITPGDVVLADAAGVVVVPRDRAEEVLDAARAIVAREHAIAADLVAGVPLPAAMTDERLAGDRKEP